MPGPGDTSHEISDGLFLGPVIQARDVGSVTLRLPVQVPSALSGLPPASAAFSGRDTDLARLLGCLEAPSPAVVAAVGGMGGVGKTELAVQAARAAVERGWFPGGVLFADMFGYDPDRRPEPTQALEGFLRAVGVPGEHIPPDPQDRSRLFRSVLEAYAREGRRILVVIDNVASVDQARPLLPAVGAAIVTSRERLSELDARLLDLGALPAEAAVELLDRALRLREPADTRVTAEPEHARRLAELCGGLPLALRIVAATLAGNTAKPLAAMAAELADTAIRVEELEPVSAVFDLSYRRLSDEHTRLYRLLSASPGPDISTTAAAALADRPETRTRRALDALARAHLVEPGSVYGRWRLHDLLRLHSARHGRRNAGADRRDQAWARLLDHYLVTARAGGAHLDASPGPVFADRRRALEWLDAEYQNLTAAVVAAGAQGRWAVARDLPAAMWPFLRLRRYFVAGLRLQDTALEAARALDDRPGEADVLATLAGVLRELRRFEEAIVTGRQGIDRYRELGDRRGVAAALTGLGLVYRDMRRFVEAVAAHREAIVAFRDLGERHGEAVALDSLGVALRGGRRFEEAAAAHRDAVAIFRDLGDRHREAMAVNNLGTALRRLDRFEEAIPAHEKAIALFRDLDDRHGEARALNNLGGAYRFAGRVAEAVAMHEAAAAIFNDLGDHYREGTARRAALEAPGGGDDEALPSTP